MGILNLITKTGNLTRILIEKDDFYFNVQKNNYWSLNYEDSYHQNISGYIYKKNTKKRTDILKRNFSVKLFFKNIKKPYIIDNLMEYEIYIELKENSNRIELKIKDYIIQYKDEALVAVVVVNNNGKEEKKINNNYFISLEGIDNFISLKNIYKCELMNCKKGFFKGRNQNVYIKYVKSYIKLKTPSNEMKTNDSLLIAISKEKKVLIENILKEKFSFNLKKEKLFFKSEDSDVVFENIDEEVENISILDKKDLILYKHKFESKIKIKKL